MAAVLGVSETSVATQVAHVLSKLHVRDRVHPVLLAYGSGTVAPERHS